MRFAKFRVQSLLIAALLLPQLVSAVDGQVAIPAPPTVKQKHLISNAIQVSLTARGASFLSTGLDDILASQGLSLEQGYFQGFSWEANRNYAIDDLSLSKEQRDMLIMIKNLLAKWLVGFTFNDFRPTIQVGDLGYIAKFNKFALVRDTNLLRKLGKKTGAVLAVEMDIENITAVTDQIRASDQNNQFLGQVGIDGLSVRLGSKQNPLKVRLPFYVRINEQRQLEFEAVEFRSNLETVDMELKYKKLVVPQVAIEVNGHRFEMNQKQLETEVQEKMPEILVQVRGFLKKFASEQLPALLNEQSKTLLAGSVEELSYMDPVGATVDPCLPPPTPFIWGLTPKPDGLADTGLDLRFNLDAFVEDPNNANLPVDSLKNAKGQPNLDRIPTDSYDISLAIDRGFINRMLQLSYYRGVFNNMPIDSSKPQGPKMDLSKQPEFTYAMHPSGAPAGPGIAYMKMVTRARIHKGFLKGFLQSSALKEPFEVDLGVIVKMVRNQYGQIHLYYYGIDPAMVKIDEKYLTWIGSMADGKVHTEAVAALEEVAAQWRATSALVSADPLPIPQEVAGIRLEPTRIEFQPSGHLVLYMIYPKPGSPLPPITPPKQCVKKAGGK